VISDDSQFSGDVTGRWQSERNVPTFTLMGGDLVQGLDSAAFDLAVVGRVLPKLLPGVLKTIESLGKPVVLVGEENESAREVRGKSPRVIGLRRNEDWLDTLVLVVSEVLRRFEATGRLYQAEQTIVTLERQAALGRYVLEMRHNLNNALTSVLGNAELLLVDPEPFSPQVRSQLETVRTMSLRMHEILQRFSSLEKELNLTTRPVDKQMLKKSQAASTGA
jgi:signal transduction histidine kinase